jgi:hypothetical protein
MTTNGDAFAAADQQDRTLASDGRSRFGIYLAQRQHLFRDDVLDKELTSSAARFALQAWTVATPPVMAPGYVICHPRIQATTFHWDDYRVALAVEIAVPAPPITNRLPSCWQSWFRNEWTNRWRDPYTNDTVTALSSLTVRIPIETADLPQPRYHDGVPDTITAKTAVAALCRLANTELDELLSALDAPHTRRTAHVTH